MEIGPSDAGREIFHSSESMKSEDTMAKFEVYKDKEGQYRWRLIAPNGRNIASSGEGFSSKQACLDGIASVKKDAPEAEIIEAA
jgi:uncharacterized protein YegP (UPF0339 family)